MLKHEVDVIVDTLLRSSDYLKLEDLAAVCRTSRKTVSRLIADHKDLLSQYGIDIISSRGKGYAARITDQDLFSRYENSKLKYNSGFDMVDRNDERVRYIESLYITAENFIHQEDLCAQLHISEGTLKKAIQDVRKEFRKNGIQIRSVPYHGSVLAGDEFQIRLFMANHFSLHTVAKKTAEVLSQSDDKINETVLWCRAVFWKYRINLTDDSFYFLTKYLLTSLMRIRNGHDIPESAPSVSEDMISISKECFSFLDDSYSDSEIRRFAQLLSITAHDRSLQQCSDFRQILSDYFSRSEYPFLAGDETMMKGLMLHIESLKIRMAIGYIPYQLPEINRLNIDQQTDRLVKGLIHEIETYFGSVIDEAEYPLLAMHILIALQQKKYQNRKQICLVCPSSFGTQYYLRVCLENELNLSGSDIRICTFDDLKNSDTSKSLIISTKMIPSVIKEDYILIDCPVSDEQMKKIKDALYMQ